MILDDIGEFLESKSIGVVGTSIFLGELPATPDAVVAIFEYAGDPPSKIGNARSPGIQVRVRDATYQAARITIDAIYALFFQIGNEQDNDNEYASGLTINDTTYLLFETVQEPFPLGPDSQDRQELAQNYIVTYPRS